MKILHSLKIKFLKIKWYFDLLDYSKKHSKEVENYKFLKNLRQTAHLRFLELEKSDPENGDLYKLKIQIELIDKILNYADR